MGLQPFTRPAFTRPASPAWVSANLAYYVKDLDVLESKMLTLGKPKAAASLENQDGEEVPQPKRPPKIPKRRAQKGNAGQGDGGEG